MLQSIIYHWWALECHPSINQKGMCLKINNWVPWHHVAFLCQCSGKPWSLSSGSFKLHVTGIFATFSLFISECTSVACVTRHRLDLGLVQSSRCDTAQVNLVDCLFGLISEDTIDWDPMDHCTSNLFFYHCSNWKICIAVIQLLAMWSLQIFVHATTAQLLWHMQKFVAIML